MDDYIGEIVPEPDSPGINNECWIEIIREHPNLAPYPPKEAINPFTKKPMIIRPRPDTARVVVDGKEVGSMEWAQDGRNTIVVWGDSDAVHPLVRDIAKALGGRLDEARIA